MPMYSFYCQKHHETERVASIHKVPGWVKCRCGRRAKLGLAPSIHLTGAVKNAPLDRKQREMYARVFGKKKASKMRTTADVEANLTDFACRYPHLMPGYKRGRSYDLNSSSDVASLGIPGDRLSDPFPDAQITEEKRNNMSQGSRR